MKVAAMQPYFFPYIGYFQLIGSVDLFIVGDDIQYVKERWINRNRMLENGKVKWLSLPLKRDSHLLDVRDRELTVDFKRQKLLNQIGDAYRRAPYFAQTFPLIEQIVWHEERNLFKFIHNSIIRTCKHLGIATEIGIASTIVNGHDFKKQNKVFTLCEAVGASIYVNPIGGMELYSRDEFRIRGIELKFLRSKPFEYAQFGNEFVPWLSIIDVMMFNPMGKIYECITGNFDLV